MGKEPPGVGSPRDRRAVWRAFVAGLTRPSPAALLGTLAVTGLLWLASCALVRPAALPAGRWVVSPTDDFAWAAGNIVRYSQAAPGSFHVALVGSSATREALTSGKHLAQLVADRVGRPVEVHTLLAGSLFPLEALIAADWMPPDAPGLMVLEVSARNLGAEPEEWDFLARNQRIPLDSPSRRAALREAGHGPAVHVPTPHLLAQRDFYASRHLVALAPGREPVAYLEHQVDWMAPPSRDEWRAAGDRYLQQLEAHETYRGLNVSVYERLVARVAAQGQTDVALLQAPRNPWLLDDVEARDPDAVARGDRYRAGVRQLADELGAPLWDFVDEIPLEQEDFRDYAHVNDPDARKAFTVALADAIAAQVAADGGAR